MFFSPLSRLDRVVPYPPGSALVYDPIILVYSFSEEFSVSIYL
jgi:hypothetical protein